MNGYGRTDKGMVRQENQDAFHIQLSKEGDRGLFLVCDGMGGAKAGGVASRLAAEAFAKSVRANFLVVEREDALCECLRLAASSANEAVYMLACADPSYKGMGTTLVGALAVGENVALINVGDSRAYHVKDGGIFQITRDHSVVEDMILRGDITREEAQSHPNKNLITRAIGTEAFVRADTFTIKLRRGEKLLLCTDGLTNVVEDQEILEELGYQYGPDKHCEMLLHLAIAKGAPDNVTVLLIEA